ncbi:MAG TPA: SURF1 family protein [Rudaea sp.]|nr:SURF1 family protein [Rudaea sp.]
MTSRRWRRPSVFALGLTIAGAAAFAALGVWQLDRAAQKERLLASFAAGSTAPLVELADVRDRDVTQQFPHVHAAGRFVADRGYLLDEQIHAGQVGVRAIGVFAAEREDRLLLVDRGWLPWNHAPGTRPAVPPLPEGEQSLSGIYAPFPGGGLAVGGDALKTQAAWPKLTLRLDAAAVAADLGKPVLPRILLLDPTPDSGFVREWTPNVMPPARHRAYAFQWFTFAVAALAIFVAIHWRKVENATS